MCKFLKAVFYLILLWKNVCYKPCFSVLKYRDYLLDDNFILLYREIYACLSKAKYTKIARPLFGYNLCFYREIYALVLAKACSSVQNSAATFRVTILFFCRELYE